MDQQVFLKKHSELKKIFLDSLQSKSKINNIFDWSIYVAFSLVFFSIPSCSFINGLNIITWLLTFLLLGLIVFSFFLFYKIKVNLISISFLLFAFCVLISFLFNGFDYFVGTPIYLSLVSLILYTYVLSNPESKPFLLFMAFVGTCGFLLVFLVKYFPSLSSFNFERLGNAFGDENDIAIFMCFGATISLYTFLIPSTIWEKIVSFLLYLCFSFCGISSGSKIFLVIEVVAFVLLIFLKFGKNKAWISLLIVIGFVGLGLICFQLPFMNTLKQRVLLFLNTLFFPKSNSRLDYSTVDRLQMFKSGFDMFLKKPLFGYGAWGFAKFGDFNNGWSHNHFSETLCNFGLIGSFFFHFGYGYALFSYFKSQNKHKLELPFVILIFYFCMMFSVALNSQKIYSYTSPIVIAFFDDPKHFFVFNLKGKRHEKIKSC